MGEKEDKIKAMAELLLSKATMLQYHCGECGSPLFQKENKIICPACGELEKPREEEAEERREAAEPRSFQDFLGKTVVVKTEATAYRGKCEKIDEETLSITLSSAERLKPFAKPTEAEWIPLSERLIIYGSMIEAVWLEKQEKT